MSHKRHVALQHLSNDHHLFLAEVREIRLFLEDDEQAKPLRDVIESLLTFWNDIGLAHIQEEEEILYPVYLQSDPLRKREIDALYTDHNWLRDKMQELADLPRFETSRPALRSISEYIANHVHHEETVIYDTIQATLPEEQLQSIEKKSRTFRETHRKTEEIDSPDFGEV